MNTYLTDLSVRDRRARILAEVTSARREVVPSASDLLAMARRLIGRTLVRLGRAVGGAGAGEPSARPARVEVATGR